MGRSSVTGGQTCAPPTFTIDASTDVTKGKVTNNGDGTFSYDPNGAFASLAAGQSTTDSFLYTVKDAAGATSTATVAITIIGQNDPPRRSGERRVGQEGRARGAPDHVKNTKTRSG